MSNKLLATENNEKTKEIDDLINKCKQLCVRPHEVKVIVYHNPCFDGCMAMTVGKLFLTRWGLEVECIGIPPGSIPPLQKIKNKPTVFLDGHPRTVADAELVIKMTGEKCIFLDHHKTGEELFKKIPDKFKVFDMKHSGAYLAWVYFFNNEFINESVPKAINYIQDNDLWTNKMPGIKDWVAGISQLDFKYKAYSKFLPDPPLTSLELKGIKTIVGEEVTKLSSEEDDYNLLKRQINVSNEKVKRLIRRGKVLSKAKVKFVKEKMRHVNFLLCEIGRNLYLVGYLHANQYYSELGNSIITNFPFADFAGIVNYNSHDQYTQFSLRSDEKHQDVSLIAKLFGGGGHRNAAGCQASGCLVSLPGRVYQIGNPYNILQNFSQIKSCLIENFKSRMCLFNSIVNLDISDKICANIEKYARQKLKIGLINSTAHMRKVAQYLFQKNKFQVFIVYCKNDKEQKYYYSIHISIYLKRLIKKSLKKFIKFEKQEGLKEYSLQLESPDSPNKLIKTLFVPTSFKE